MGSRRFLYAFTSASQNNGSAFAGLSANSVFYNSQPLSACSSVGSAIAILTLALAGSLVVKRSFRQRGTLSDHRPLFIIWLVFVVLIIGALSFLPALALVPLSNISCSAEVYDMPEPAGTRNPHTVLPAIYRRAVIDAVVKLDPRLMIKNPVMFVVEAGSALTTLLWLQALTGNGEAPPGSSCYLVCSGSPSSLQTLPRHSPKEGARPGRVAAENAAGHNGKEAVSRVRD